MPSSIVTHPKEVPKEQVPPEQQEQHDQQEQQLIEERMPLFMLALQIQFPPDQFFF